nr:uncharacterized protein LOC113803201 [Penaeus vannamei]
MKGVGFLVHKNSVKSVLECTPISSRIISIRLAAKPQNISIIQVYAPTKASDEEILEQFYKELEERIKQIPGKDVLIVQEFRATLGGKFAPLLLLDNIQEISTEMEKAINGTAMDMLGTYKKENILGNSGSAAGLTSNPKDEIIAAIKKLKNSKSPGTDNITAELLKAGGDPVPSIVSVLKSLYEHAKNTVLIGDKYSPWFKSNVGVRQGCVLSPTLFNIFLEQIMMDTLDSFDTFKSGVKIGGQTITNLRFADDIDLICSNEEDLQQLTLLLDVTARKYGMETDTPNNKTAPAGAVLHVAFSAPVRLLVPVRRESGDGIAHPFFTLKIYVLVRQTGHQVDIAALSETRFPGETQLEEVDAGYTFYCIGQPRDAPRISGVGFAIRTKFARS